MNRISQRRGRLMRRGLWYSLALCLVILLMDGVGFWVLEPTSHSLQEGLWLAFTTAATVGYGEVVPQTPVGRAFAVLVVLLGLAVLSLVTVSLAALFVERDVAAHERAIERDLMREIRALRQQVEGLQQRLHAQYQPTRDTERSTG